MHVWVYWYRVCGFYFLICDLLVISRDGNDREGST